jgi:hypothetical protein
MASFACCADGMTSRSNVLSFFAVSESPIPGGRSIDTPEFPKLGYTRAQADMVDLQVHGGTSSRTAVIRNLNRVITGVRRAEIVERDTFD